MAQTPPPWLQYIEGIRGRVRLQVSLAESVWFRVGGPADILFRPADVADLQHFLTQKPAEIPVCVLGLGSNVLVRDGGIPGVVIRLGRGFVGIKPEGTTLLAGAATPDAQVAQAACEQSLAGLEFLSGIPGTMGGAVAMNAGAYGSEIADVLESVEAISLTGERRVFEASEMGFSYRHQTLGHEWIFTAARLKGTPGDKAEIAARMREIEEKRSTTQPIRTRTGGSTFQNPSAAEAGGKKAWELIEAAGCRGMREGGAMVSKQHCNFMENTGHATACELERLGENVRAKVKAQSGIDLTWEIQRLGIQATGE